MRKAVLSCLIIMLLLISGCEKKEALVAIHFRDKMEEKGYIVGDAKDAFNIRNARDAYLAYTLKDPSGKNHSNIQAEFYTMLDVKQAKESFKTMRNNLEEQKGHGAVTSKSGSGNYSKYTVQMADQYYSISRIDETILLVYGLEDEVSAVDELVASLGY